MANKQTKTKIPAAEQQPKPEPDEAANQNPWGDDAPTGFEGTRAEDMGIPFIYIVQKGSPEVDEDHKDHETKKIDGAKVGFIVNSLSRKIIYARDEEDPLLFVPFYHERLYVEWKDRKQGGGFVKAHRTPVILTQCTRDENNHDILPNGNIVHTTSYIYGYYLVDGITQFDHEDESKRPVRAIIGLTGMQLKKAKMWLNMADAIKINGKRPPLYSHIYNLTSTAEENAKGNWWGWVVGINRSLTMADVSVVQECKKHVIEYSKNNQLLLSAPTETQPTEEDSNSEFAEAEAAKAARRVN